jgi:multimeric flavodoxin WrbA
MEKTKIVCILGSPRPKGNSSTLAKRFCDRTRKLGAKVELFQLSELTYRGCQGCMACKTKSDKCTLTDDLEKVLESVRGADVLVMASPIYYGEVSSQLKAFIDRTYSFFASDYLTNPQASRLPAGKKMVFILTQGQPCDTLFDDVFPRHDFFFKWYGFEESYLIRACGVMNIGDVDAHRETMRSATETAEKIMGFNSSVLKNVA